MKHSMARGTARCLLPALLAGCAALAAEPQKSPPPGPTKITPKVGTFMVTMHSNFATMPKTLQLMDFWFPLPIEGPHQKIYQRIISAPYDMDMLELEDHTAAVAYMKGAPRGGLPLQARITFYLERTEDVAADFSKAVDKPVTEEEKQIHERWVKPDTLVTVDKEMKSIASKIVSGKKKTLDRARAIYDHLVTQVKTVTPYELRGAGYGNAKFTMTQMQGDDIDIASAFVGLCRALSIPARTIIGIKFPEGMPSGDINGYHSWAEFYVDGVGWVPVDPAMGRREVRRRSYYFGALDERRLAMSIGRDVRLVPPQAGALLNYWIKPYWEGDQKPMPDPFVEIAFEEVKEIPGRAPAPAVTGSAGEPPVASPAAPQKPPR